MKGGGGALSPRGKTVNPTRWIEFDNGVEYRNSLPGIIVYLRLDDGDAMKQLQRYVKRHGVFLRPLQGGQLSRTVDIRGEGWESDAYEATATGTSWEAAEAKLEYLKGHPAVDRWHAVLSVRVHVSGSGSGEYTQRHKADRRAAVAETLARVQDGEIARKGLPPEPAPPTRPPSGPDYAAVRDHYERWQKLPPAARLPWPAYWYSETGTHW